MIIETEGVNDMKNTILLIAFIVMMGFSLILEPINNSVDIIAGVTNDTYDTSIDQIAGSTRLNSDDDDEDEDEDEDESNEYEDD